MIKKCQISCEYFWGFNQNIDINIYNTKEKIIEQILYLLEIFLINNNLIVLKEILDKIKNKYHIHDMDITNNNTIYICNHAC